MKPNHHHARSFALALVFVLLMHPYTASGPWAAKVQTNECTTTSSNCRIRISGRIAEGDYQAIERTLEGYRKSDLLFVDVNSGGGDVLEAMKIGRLLRRFEAAIYVGPSSQCSSACVMLIAGAAYRAGIFGQVGIHRPFDDRPRALSTQEAQSEYVQLVKTVKEYFSSMNVSDRLLHAMMAVPPNKVRFLSPRELSEFGLTDSDPATASRDDARSALIHNVSVAEFYARSRRADSQCGELLSPKLGFENTLRCRQTILYGIPYSEIERRRKQMALANCDDSKSEEDKGQCLVDAFWR